MQFLSLWTEKHAPVHLRQGGFNTNNRTNIEASRIYSERGVYFRSSLVDLWLASYRWQISKEALERSETKRLQYQLRMASQYSADQLVFVDESACDRRTYLRGKAWALEGHQAVRKQVFLRGKRYVPPPLSRWDPSQSSQIFYSSCNYNRWYDLLHNRGRVLQFSIVLWFCRLSVGTHEPVASTEFCNRHGQLRNPQGARGSGTHRIQVCLPHLLPTSLDPSRLRGMKLELLPTYSPDFNPIELSFSLLKARLRNVRWSHEEIDAVFLQLYGEVMSISAQDCRAFYTHCGYIR